MKKERKQLWINKSLWFKIDNLLKTHPHHPLVDYRSKTEFVEKTIEEKFDEIRDKLILEKIANSGLDFIISEVKDFRKKIERGDAISRRLSKKVDEMLSKKHTHRVYKPMKK